MRKTIIICDICKKEHNNKPMSIQVIFTTEQNEGKTCVPYFDNVSLDLCSDCVATALTGKSIFATGAMGYNDYYFIKN